MRRVNLIILRTGIYSEVVYDITKSLYVFHRIELWDEFPVAVADEDLRKSWTNKLIGMGTVICARVTVSAGSKIDNNCIITSGSIIPRKTVLPDWAYFEIDKWEFYKEEYDIPKLEKNEEN